MTLLLEYSLLSFNALTLVSLLRGLRLSGFLVPSYNWNIDKFRRMFRESAVNFGRRSTNARTQYAQHN